MVKTVTESKYPDGVVWHYVQSFDKDGAMLEQHLVADNKGEDCNAYDRRDALKAVPEAARVIVFEA
jgi:hypothetical protein